MNSTTSQLVDPGVAVTFNSTLYQNIILGGIALLLIVIVFTLLSISNQIKDSRTIV